MLKTLKEKRKVPGPGQYNLHEIMDRWRRERPCSTKIQKPHIKHECYYDCINGQLVLQPSIMRKQDRRALLNECEEILQRKPLSKHQPLGHVYQQLVSRNETPNRPMSAQTVEPPRVDHWTSRLARRSHNFTRRFSASANFTDNRRRKRSNVTESREGVTVKFHQSVAQIDDLGLVNNEAIKQTDMNNKKEEEQQKGEEYSSTKVTEHTHVESQPIQSRSQQSLMLSRGSNLKNHGYSSAFTTEQKAGTASEAQLQGQLNQINEKDSFKGLTIQDLNQTGIIQNRLKTSSRNLSDRPTSATNSKTANKYSTKSSKPLKKLKEMQKQKRRRTQTRVAQSRAYVDRDRGYYRDILSTNSYVEYNLQHPMNLSLSCISSPDTEKPFLAWSSDKF